MLQNSKAQGDICSFCHCSQNVKAALNYSSTALQHCSTAALQQQCKLILLPGQIIPQSEASAPFATAVRNSKQLPMAGQRTRPQKSPPTWAPLAVALHSSKPLRKHSLLLPRRFGTQRSFLRLRFRLPSCSEAAEALAQFATTFPLSKLQRIVRSSCHGPSQPKPASRFVRSFGHAASRLRAAATHSLLSPLRFVQQCVRLCVCVCVRARFSQQP